MKILELQFLNYFEIFNNKKHDDKELIDFLDSKKCYLINLTGMPRTDKLIVELFGSFKQGEKDCFEKILLRHGVDERFLALMHLLNPNSKNKLHDKDKHKIHEIMFSWFYLLLNVLYRYLHNLKKGEN